MSAKHAALCEAVLDWARAELVRRLRCGEHVESTRIVVWDPQELPLPLHPAHDVASVRLYVTTAARVVDELADVGIPSTDVAEARLERPSESGWLCIATLAEQRTQIWEIQLPG